MLDCVLNLFKILNKIYYCQIPLNTIIGKMDEEQLFTSRMINDFAFLLQHAFFFHGFKGGGWCNNITTCLARKNTRLGSSKQMATPLAFSGIMNNMRQYNPGIIQYLNI